MIRKLICIISCVVFLFSLGYLCNYSTEITKTEGRYNTLRKIKQSSTSAPVVSEKIEQYNSLLDVNEDYVGWLSNNDIIDYPIVFNEDNTDFYLSKDFYKYDSVSGCLFTRSEFDLTDKVTIIYGHNMKNNSMFGTLDYYKDEKYLTSHSSMTISDLNKNYNLKILGTIVCNVEFNYQDYIGDLSESSFNGLLKFLSSNLVNGSIGGVSYEDSLVLLSTCDYSGKNNRLLLVCRIER